MIFANASEIAFRKFYLPNGKLRIYLIQPWLCQNSTQDLSCISLLAVRLKNITYYIYYLRIKKARYISRFAKYSG